MDAVDPTLMQDLLYRGFTYAQIADELRRRYPSITRGLSERSIRRFVTASRMRQTVKQHKEEVLAEAIEEVRF